MSNLIERFGSSQILPRRRKTQSFKNFVRGPIQLEWMQATCRLGGKCTAIGVCIWYLKGMSKFESIILSPSVLRKFGVGRHSVYRHLAKLEVAGLIEVKRSPGSAFRVKVVCLPEISEVSSAF